MTRLFNQEKVWEIELKAYGREERKEGLKEGEQVGMAKLLKQMLANASILDVSRITGISQEEISRIIGVDLHT